MSLSLFCNCHQYLHVIIVIVFVLQLSSISSPPPVLPQLNPLISVANTGVLYQGPEDHEEANEQVDVDGLHVRDLGQRRIHRVDQGGHRQHSGDSQANL